MSPDELTRSVHTVVAGEALLAPSIVQRMIDAFVSRPLATSESPPQLQNLTVREIEVLVALSHGQSNPEIAEQLFPSAATVKTRVACILATLGVRDRVRAVIAAYETGLVDPHV